jgi:hypothetical protein
MSFNPTTGLIYFPAALSSSFTYTVQPDFQYSAGRQNMGISFGRGGPGGGPGGGRGDAAAAPPPPAPKTPPTIGPAIVEGQRNALLAWDPVTQKERWRAPVGGSIGGGTVTTAGNLVFQVIPDGRLMAYSADKGEKLLEIQTGMRGGMGPPITYSLDGKQYIAFTGGTGSFGNRGAAPPPPPAAGAAGAARGGNDSPDVANAQAAQAAAKRGGAPAAGAGPGPGPGPGGFPGGPAVNPKMLVFMLDGKAPLPAAAQ